MKYNKLSFSLLWKIFILLVISFFVLGYISVIRVKKYNRETIIRQSEETINELLWVVANINSVMMQQMRSYTMLNDICYTNSDPLIIQKELIRLSDRRYKDFISISYVDYESGMEYEDTGAIRDVRNTDYFIKMRLQRKQNKGLQLYGDVIENFYYTICKDNEVRIDGYSTGFFVGKVYTSYLQRYMNKLKGNSFDSPIGFLFILSNKFEFICSPEPNITKDKKFIENEELKIDKELIEYIKNPIDKKPTGEKICISGTVTYLDKRYVTVVGMFSKTNWTIGVSIPIRAIDKISDILVTNLIISSVLMGALSISVIYILFLVSFDPLSELSDTFINIANGDADLTKRIKITDKTEIGIIQNSFNEFLIQMQNMISEIGNSKKDLVSVEQKLATILERTKKELKKIDDNIDKFKLEDKEKIKNIKSILSRLDAKVKDLEEVEKILNSNYSDLDASSTSIDIITSELENMIKISYKAVNQISEMIDGFIY